VFSNVSANWASADAGTINFSWGWMINGSTESTLVQTNQVPAGWSYSFTTGASAARFTMNWSTTVAGNTFGLQNLFGSGGLPFNVTAPQIAPTDGSGSFFVDLAANTAYDFGIFNFGNLNSNDGLTSITSSNVDLSWSIANLGGAVPEPSTWAMMILGFGFVGSSMRLRIRRTVATA